MADAPAPAAPLRSRLFLLAASGLIPFALVALMALAWSLQDRRQEAQRSALELSRALATAVDAEFRATVGVLNTLAEADALQRTELRDFHALAQRVAQRQGWQAVVLADDQGRVVLSSAQPLDATLAQPVDTESLTQALQRREPVVGRVLRGPNRQVAAFAVRVPLPSAQARGPVLSAVIPADKIVSVITRQHVPPHWTVAVFDQGGTRVARTRDNAANRPSPSLQAMLDSGDPEGMGETRTLEGEPADTGYTRLASSGWVVAVGIARAKSDEGLPAVLGAVAGGLLASLALSAFLAWYFARQVSKPIDHLKAAAIALGRGERVRVPPLGVAELDAVGAALSKASAEQDRAAQARRDAEAERERLLARANEVLRPAEIAGRGRDNLVTLLGQELRASQPPAPVPSRPLPPSQPSAASRRVLVVDDNRDAADTCAALLEMSGHAVRVAYDAPQAVALWAEFAPHVALIDIGLPQMSGYELAQALRQHAPGRALRLVALARYGTRADPAAAVRAGFDAHLVKPAPLAEVLAEVARSAVSVPPA